SLRPTQRRSGSCGAWWWRSLETSIRQQVVVVSIFLITDIFMSIVLVIALFVDLLLIALVIFLDVVFPLVLVLFVVQPGEEALRNLKQGFAFLLLDLAEPTEGILVDMALYAIAAHLPQQGRVDGINVNAVTLETLGVSALLLGRPSRQL